ncbi:MAG: single-stranded-DNA-specific exonuclease [Thermosediminibacterales bacterium]|nr:single-stranded-DNA-specific exonuclease [Thermosediminibacterales bacterium]
MQEKKWVLCDILNSESHIERLLKNNMISPVLAHLLVNRNIKTLEEAEKFLNPKLDYLYDPFLLKDMKKAVNRIKRAIELNEKILVFGDYDVDGITSSSILLKTLGKLKAKAFLYIPNRINEGYGLNLNAVEKAFEDDVSLIITVDCGISSYNEILRANELGIDVIVTDHHEPPQVLPNAYAIINPKQKECPYPFKELAGVGVTFKLISALIDENRLWNDELEELLQEVALGTVADIVPLVDENRVLVKKGLENLSKTKLPGIKALLKVSGLENVKDVTTGHVGFVLAPRINAAGRLADPVSCVKLLMSENDEEAIQLASYLDSLNRERQVTEDKIYKEALDLIYKEIDLNKDKVIVVSSENWHPGIIGIVASRITEFFNRPSILISLEGEKGRGSGRSISGFNLYNALQKSEEFLESYGGHEQAAGISIHRENIKLFRNKINQIADETINEIDLIPSLKVDCKIPLNVIDEGLIKELNKLKPFGIGNPAPVFITEKLKVENLWWVGKKANHLKIKASDGKKSFDCIAFNMEEFNNKITRNCLVDLAYCLEVNEWNGKYNIQLKIKDIHFVDISQDRNITINRQVLNETEFKKLLRVLYISLKKYNSQNQQQSINVKNLYGYISQRTNLNRDFVNLGLRIFKDVNLLAGEISENDGKIKLIPPPSKKLDLRNSKIYRQALISCPKILINRG